MRFRIAGDEDASGEMNLGCWLFATVHFPLSPPRSRLMFVFPVDQPICRSTRLYVGKLLLLTQNRVLGKKTPFSRLPFTRTHVVCSITCEMPLGVELISCQLSLPLGNIEKAQDTELSHPPPPEAESRTENRTPRLSRVFPEGLGRLGRGEARLVWEPIQA